MKHVFGETFLKSVQTYEYVTDFGPFRAKHCEQCVMQGVALPTYQCALTIACVFLQLA